MSKYNFLYVVVLIILIFFLSNDIYINKYLNIDNRNHIINQVILILIIIYLIYNDYSILFIIIIVIIYLFIILRKKNIINIESFENVNENVVEPFKNKVTYIKNLFKNIQKEYFN